MLPENELHMLRKLERKVRKMFAFTGWDDDIDGEPAACVHAVEQALDDIESARRLFRDQKRPEGKTASNDNG